MKCNPGFYLIFICFIHVQILHAQLQDLENYTGKDKFQNFGLLVSYNANQDQKLTDQVYDGYGGGLHMGEVSYHKRKYMEFRFMGGYEYLRSPHEYISQQFWGNLQYRYLFLLAKIHNWQVYLGPYIEALGQSRIAQNLSNNNVQWDVNGGIGPSLHVNTLLPEFIGIQGWRIFSDFSFPLASYVYRPNYALPSLPPELGMSYIGRIVRVEWIAGVQLPASKDNFNQYRIWYRWGYLYHRDNSVQHLISGRHSMGFSYFFNTHKSQPNEK